MQTNRKRWTDDQSTDININYICFILRWWRNISSPEWYQKIHPPLLAHEGLAKLADNFWLQCYYSYKLKQFRITHFSPWWVCNILRYELIAWWHRSVYVRNKSFESRLHMFHLVDLLSLCSNISMSLLRSQYSGRCKRGECFPGNVTSPSNKPPQLASCPGNMVYIAYRVYTNTEERRLRLTTWIVVVCFTFESRKTAVCDKCWIPCLDKLKL